MLHRTKNSSEILEDLFRRVKIYDQMLGERLEREVKRNFELSDAFVKNMTTSLSLKEEELWIEFPEHMDFYRWAQFMEDHSNVLRVVENERRILVSDIEGSLHEVLQMWGVETYKNYQEEQMLHKLLAKALANTTDALALDALARELNRMGFPRAFSCGDILYKPEEHYLWVAFSEEVIPEKVEALLKRAEDFGWKVYRKWKGGLDYKILVSLLARGRGSPDQIFKRREFGKENCIAFLTDLLS